MVLDAFDEQIRRSAEPETLQWRVERDDLVVRLLGADGGWAAVTWSDLTAGNADAVISEQVARFASLGRPWEWKHYSYDSPSDLPDRLIAAGLTPQPAESLLVAQVSDLGLDAGPPPGVRLSPIVDSEGVDALVSVHNQVFGGDCSPIGRALAAGLASQPSTAAGVVAVASGRTPVAAGRIEFHVGTEFASLWGGGTLPSWRGRGLFRALVASRASQAAKRGFRYLQVDASADSRPILLRLGFVELATTTPFVHV